MILDFLNPDIVKDEATGFKAWSVEGAEERLVDPPGAS